MVGSYCIQMGSVRAIGGIFMLAYCPRLTLGCWGAAQRGYLTNLFFFLNQGRMQMADTERTLESNCKERRRLWNK